MLDHYLQRFTEFSTPFFAIMRILHMYEDNFVLD